MSSSSLKIGNGVLSAHQSSMGSSPIDLTRHSFEQQCVNNFSVTNWKWPSIPATQILRTDCLNEACSMRVPVYRWENIRLNSSSKKAFLQLHFIYVRKLNKLLIAGATAIGTCPQCLGGDERYKLIIHKTEFICIALDCSRPSQWTLNIVHLF